MTGESLGEVIKALFESLTNFINVIVLAGNVPESICSTFYGGSLITLSKPGGGIRHIAVGCTLRRLVGKICMRKLKDKVSTLFHPYQFGVGRPLGAEIAIHCIRRYISHHPESGKVV